MAVVSTPEAVHAIQPGANSAAPALDPPTPASELESASFGAASSLKRLEAQLVAALQPIKSGVSTGSAQPVRQGGVLQVDLEQLGEAVNTAIAYLEARVEQMELAAALYSPPGLLQDGVVCKMIYNLLDRFDPKDAEHSLRVSKLARALAEEVGLDSEQCQGIEQGALLHDIGKLCIPDSVIDKRGRLSEDELKVVRLHPQFSEQILERLGLPYSFVRMASDHHERIDGSGYPMQLRGEEISIEAQICSIADVWEALRSERHYKRPWTRERAESYFSEAAGREFDAGLVAAFIRLTRSRPELPGCGDD